MKNALTKSTVLIFLLLEANINTAQKRINPICSNLYAKKIFVQKIKYIEDYIFQKSDSMYLVPTYIYDLEEITHIVSESDGNIIGKLSPTVNDIKKWMDWYKKNSYYLLWNDSLQKIHYSKVRVFQNEHLK
jgi:hypothetical protein